MSNVKTIKNKDSFHICMDIILPLSCSAAFLISILQNLFHMHKPKLSWFKGRLVQQELLTCPRHHLQFQKTLSRTCVQSYFYVSEALFRRIFNESCWVYTLKNRTGFLGQLDLTSRIVKKIDKRFPAMLPNQFDQDCFNCKVIVCLCF